MRYFLTLLVLLFMPFAVSNEIQLRDYNEFDIPAGTHLPVIAQEEFSTAYCEEGDEVGFVTTSDIFLYDKNVIPEGTLLKGYIEEKHEPIKGTNASMRVFINKMYLSDGYEVPIKAYIYTKNNNLIGGELTEPAKYNRVPHYQRFVMFRAMSFTQCVPGAERMMGKHVTVSSGADMIVVTVAPVHLTHTVIN